MVFGKVSCVLTDCEAGFDVEANFIEHLRKEHDIDKNIHLWVDFAKKRAGVDKKPVQEITLDDDDEEEEEAQIDNTVMKMQANTVLDADGGRTKSVEKKFDFAVISKNVSRNIFANCRQLLENPPRNKMDDTYKVVEGLTSEESISDFFEKLRNKVEHTAIPPELLKRLKDPDEKKMLSSGTGSFPGSDCTEHNSSNFDLQSDRESSHQTSGQGRKQYEKLLRCPVSDCEFTTDKAGMRRGEAARHLCDSHGVTARDMTPGKFTFIKIKVEKTQ